MVYDTSTHTLFPPLGDEDSKKCGMLSSELRSNFEQLRALISSQDNQFNLGLEEQKDSKASKINESNKLLAQRGKKRHHVNVTSDEKSLAQSTNTLIPSNKIQKKSDVIMSQRVHLAANTLIAAQNEISLLYNGIAELEALLSSNSEKQSTQINYESENFAEEIDKVVTNEPYSAVIPDNHCIPHDQKC